MSKSFDEIKAATATLPKLTVVELPDGEFCVVSADPTKRLTENQAEAIALLAWAMKEIFEGKRNILEGNPPN